MSLDCIFARRSIRRFSAEPVAEGDLGLVLRAAMSAPTAMGARPWEFIVVDEESERRALAAICPYWTPVERAPMAIVVCGHVRGDRLVEAFTVQDCSAATENMLLAAACLGLGGVWLGCYGVPERVEKTSSLLGLPGDGSVLPISVVALGHPAESKRPHGAADQGRIHHGRY